MSARIVARRVCAALAIALAAAGLAACGRDAGDAARGVPVVADSLQDEIDPLDSLRPLAPSVLAVPVAYDLAPAIAALEAAVPSTFGDIKARRPVAGKPRLAIAFAAERSPFTVAVRGNTATIEALITYQGRGWYKPPIVRELTGSCGLGDEPPRLRVALATTVTLNSDWTLRSRTRVPVVEPATATLRDRCRVTALGYDVTERVLAAARKQLEGKATVVDERLARTDVRERVARWWALLERPIRIRDSLWLQIHPTAVQLGALDSEEGALVAPLRLTANPRILSGPRPDSSSSELPVLGAAGSADAADGLRVLVDAVLDYPAATNIVAGKLVGKRFEHSGQRVEIRGISAAATSGGRVALSVTIAGSADGVIRFVGRPAFDSTSGELRVPDLDYDVASENVVVNGFDWLKHEDLRDTLRARARWPADRLVDQARAKLETALNRDLTRGVRLAADVPSARVLGVHAGRAGIVLRAEARGTASLRVNRAPTFGKPKAKPPSPVAAGATQR